MGHQGSRMEALSRQENRARREASKLTACHTLGRETEAAEAVGRTMWGPMLDFVNLVSAKGLALLEALGILSEEADTLHVSSYLTKSGARIRE